MKANSSNKSANSPKKSNYEKKRIYLRRNKKYSRTRSKNPINNNRTGGGWVWVYILKKSIEYTHRVRISISVEPQCCLADNAQGAGATTSGAELPSYWPDCRTPENGAQRIVSF